MLDVDRLDWVGQVRNQLVACMAFASWWAIRSRSSGLYACAFALALGRALAFGPAAFRSSRMLIALRILISCCLSDSSSHFTARETTGAKSTLSCSSSGTSKPTTSM